VKHDQPVRALPDWWRKPGETWPEWDRRMCAEKDAEYARKLNEKLAPPRDGTNIGLACGVGTYDGNGNPKGGGW
jgi:hypothetical protein